MGTTKERREQSEGDAATTHSTATTTAAAKTTTTTAAAGANTTTTATTTNAAKKIRRAFSMPRNPFRWSRKFKTAAAVTSSSGTTEKDNGSGRDNEGGGAGRERRGSHTAISSCVGGGRGRSGSIVSLSSYEAPLAPTTTNNNNMANNNTTASNGSNNNNNSSSNNNKRTRALRRSSFRKFLNRIAQHLSSTVNVVSEEHHSPANRIAFIEIVPFYTGCWRRKEANKHGQSAAPGSSAGSGGGGGPGSGERVPPIGGYQWPPDQTPGVMGLKNHGNTCFMNAVLQCLSHTDILAEYFVLDQYKADLKRRNKINSRKFGTKGELTEQLANVLKALWTCRNESDHSTSFKAVVDRYGTQFRSSTQHDAQEFLFWLLDKVHEDLNTASKRRYKSLKNSYGRSDEVIAAETLANHIRCNNSFVQAVFQAQFRSSLTCPRCEKQSNTFDPFHCISVQLPQLTQQTIFVTVVYMKQVPRQVRMGLRVPAGSPIVALREQLQTDTGIEGSRMVLVDLNAEGFSRVFYDTQPVETLASIETIYCIEVPEATPVPKAAAPPETADKPASTTVAPAPAAAQAQSDLLLLVANVYRAKDGKDISRFGAPFSMKAPRDCSFQDLQKRMLREMAPLLKPEVFSYATPLNEMFRIRLQDPSADPDTYLEQVEHPLLTEMIDMALSVLSSEAGPQHIKLLLEWSSPEAHFISKQQDTEDAVVEHESVARLSASKPTDTASLTLEQCLEHYTKAETLSAEDAWRCPHCQQYLPVVKTLGLWSLPDILVVHFKRFRQHQSKGPQAAKLTTMVKFPLTAFDMSPHLARGVHESASSSLGIGTGLGLGLGLGSNPWKKARSNDSRSSTLNSRCDPKDTRYDLYAVCYHQGDTLETGHYTAACKNPYDRQWYKFDDQRVSKVPEDDIEQDIINNEAYMLFYQRRSVDAGECSGSSSNSGDHWVSRIAPASSSSASSTSGKEPVKLEAPSEIPETPATAVAEKAQSKPVDIPKICQERAEVTEEPTDNVQEKAGVVAELNIEELAYADADVDTSLSETSKTETTAAAKVEPEKLAVEEATPIFAMDEDCIDLGQEKNEEPAKKEEESSEVPLANETVAEPKTNGHVSDASSSSSSSESSLSSRSSPRSLSTSVTAASTLQSKFNGHLSATPALFNGNGNTPQLSSSLQLSRQVLQNHHNWHGSRSSVSAVENASHHQQQQAAAAASLSLRHSFSTSSNYTETLSSLLRKSANTCSKDTLLFIDQQGHHHTSGLIEDDDDSYMGRSLWISPVTPHKLITVSPKN
ncbi:ubiquitin carboxyl-terminal hydrolase 43 isoform X1 [Drosophila suzukii]|uniref:ubiquitinyl hydrolase 1 n=1 Tax=Drosophila suzukii TaxID=28584 RepID=A0AB39Z6Z5_DROSZ